MNTRSTVSSPLRELYTVAEAAEVTGRSQKALRRRIERGTLSVVRIGRRDLFVAHSELQMAGLVDSRPRTSMTAIKLRAVIDLLRKRPRRGISAWQASRAPLKHPLGKGFPEDMVLPRQTVEVALASWGAAGLVTRELEGGVAWRWIGT
jgi:excisionase family DNA binding protein